MIESARASHLAVAGAKDQRVGRPAAPLRAREQTSKVVRADRAFQSVEYQQTPSVRGPPSERLETMKLDLVAIVGDGREDSEIVAAEANRHDLDRQALHGPPGR